MPTIFPLIIKPDKNEPQTVNFYKKSIAPEYFKTNKSDVFSLGYIIYYILLLKIIIAFAF